MLVSFSIAILLVPITVNGLQQTSLLDCLKASNVSQVSTSDSKWDKVIKPFNLRLAFTPIAVAVPSTTAQVQAAVACGASSGVNITGRSGGHSYASHGLGGEDGHLMIDMKLFNNVTVQNSTGIATIGVGGRLGNIALALFNNAARAFSHGTCPG